MPITNRLMRCLLLSTSILVSTQNSTAQFTGHYNALNITGTTNTLKTEIPLAEPSVTGSTYISDDWQPIDVYLKNGKLFSLPQGKIEIEQSMIEVSVNNERKFIRLGDIDYVNLIDKNGSVHKYRSLTAYVADGIPLLGVAEVLYSGKKYELVKNFYIEFQQAHYNVAMDVGYKDHRKLRKSKVYLLKGGSVTLIKGSSKKIVAKLGSDKQKAQQIIDEHHFNVSKEEDLIACLQLLDK